MDTNYIYGEKSILYLALFRKVLYFIECDVYRSRLQQTDC